jgi:hypothetical protein
MLKLRQDLPENFRITKQIPGVGQVMFNSEKVQPHEYEKWHKLGFADLFEEYVVEPLANVLVEKVVDEVKEVIKKRRRRKNEDQTGADKKTV